MMRSDSYVKVLDFGLAKLTEQPTIDVTTAVGARVEDGHRSGWDIQLHVTGAGRAIGGWTGQTSGV